MPSKSKETWSVHTPWAHLRLGLVLVPLHVLVVLTLLARGALGVMLSGLSLACASGFAIAFGACPHRVEIDGRGLHAYSFFGLRDAGWVPWDRVTDASVTQVASGGSRIRFSAPSGPLVVCAGLSAWRVWSRLDAIVPGEVRARLHEPSRHGEAASICLRQRWRRIRSVGTLAIILPVTLALKAAPGLPPSVVVVVLVVLSLLLSCRVMPRRLAIEALLGEEALCLMPHTARDSESHEGRAEPDDAERR